MADLTRLPSGEPINFNSRWHSVGVETIVQDGQIEVIAFGDGTSVPWAPGAAFVVEASECGRIIRVLSAARRRAIRSMIEFHEVETGHNHGWEV